MQIRHLVALTALVLGAAPISCQDAAAADDRIPALLITGANNHDWEWTAPRLAKILENSGRFVVTTTKEPGKTLADAKAISKYKVFVLDYNGPRWGAAAEANFLKAVESGTGVSVVHASDNPFPRLGGIREDGDVLLAQGHRSRAVPRVRREGHRSQSPADSRHAGHALAPR